MGPHASYAPPPQKSGFPVWLIVILAIVGAGILIGGILVVLGIYGTRKYIANAKTAEARNTLGMLSKDAVSAYEAEELALLGGAPVHRLCASASHPVPLLDSMVSGRKYQSTSSDWLGDKPINAGFSCLKFEMMSPQYYQYDYKRTGTGSSEGDRFDAIARGDLDGNGVFSTFTATGQISGGHVLVAPTILELNPDE